MATEEILAAMVLLGAAAASTSVFAQDAPVVVEGPHGGQAVYSSAERKASQDRWGYAGTYRAGDYVYLSGVVAGAWEVEKLDIEGYKSAVRRAFERADTELKAAGSGLAEVVDLVSFHVWDSPYLELGRVEHLDTLAAVKREVMPLPDPAWTAVGTSGLIAERGLVEMRMIAYSPQGRNGK